MYIGAHVCTCPYIRTDPPPINTYFYASCLAYSHAYNCTYFIIHCACPCLHSHLLDAHVYSYPSIYTHTQSYVYAHISIYAYTRATLILTPMRVPILIYCSYYTPVAMPVLISMPTPEGISILVLY